MDISKLSIQELKAIAYDELIKLQTVQDNLNLIQQELARRTKTEVSPETSGQMK